MIGYIIWDCLPFLFLTFVVMAGFGVALPVMLRGPQVSTKKDVEDDFGGFDKSLFTLFFALLGDFDKEVGDLQEIALQIQDFVCLGLQRSWESDVFDEFDLCHLPAGDICASVQPLDLNYGRHF